MRKYLIAVIILVIIGAGASFYLIPSESDIVVMRDQDAAGAPPVAIDFQAEFDKGVRTEPVLVGIADIYITQGRGMEILSTLEEDARTNPDHLDVRKKLAELYQAAGRDQDYLREMEAIAALDASEANLKLLADMYNYQQMYDKQSATLRKMIDVSGGSNPEYYVDLATILMVEEKKAEALAVVEELQVKHPTYRSFKMVRLLVAGLVDKGEMEKALTEASSWASGSNQAIEIADLTNILHYGGRPDLALQFIEPHRDIITSNADLLTAYVNAMIGAGHSDQAYALLTKLHQQKALPAPLYRPFIELALARTDSAMIDQILSNLQNGFFTEDQAIILLELARTSQMEPVITQLVVLFAEPAYLENKVVLSAIIALMRRDSDEDQKIDAALQTKLSRTHMLKLAQVCALHHKEPCFETIIKRMPSLAEMSARELDDVVNLYIQIDRQSDILDAVAGIDAGSDSELIELAHMKLAASTGKLEVFGPWLERHRATASTATLSQLFFLANDRRHSKTAIAIAAILFERDPNIKHREYLISGYMNAGEYDLALPLVRDVRTDSRLMEDNYLAALTRLSRGNSNYSSELVEYVIPQLSSDQISSERKLQLVYMLINTGNKAKAVPFIDQYAKAEGGDWKTLYNQIHAVAGSSKPGKPALADMPRDYRIALATDPKTDISTRRMLAFSLIDDGFRRDAVAIFYEMAQGKSPDSQEVKDLLYLWGPRLNEEQVSWLASQANHATTDADRVRWGAYIATYGDDFALMRYVSNTPSALAHPSVRQKYFRALVTNTSADTFDQGMQKWVDATQDPAALNDYADVAKAYGYQEAAITALKKAETLSAQSEANLKDLAILSYSKGNYSDSARYLDQYMQVHSQSANPQTNPFEAYFFRGELYRRAGDIQSAQQYYGKVLEMGQRVANTVQLQSIYYTSQFHMGNFDTGKQGFYSLIQQHPDDKSLLADFMSVLIEYKFHDEASAVANQYDPTTTRGKQSNAVMIQSPNIAGVESFEEGRELRVNFSGRVDPAVIAATTEKQEWLEETSVGYDSVLIAAKPGYRVQFTPTSASSIAVVGNQGTPMTAQERLDRQQDLRLQLLYARVEMETGQQQQALNRLNILREHYPNDAQLMGYTANAETSAGNWSRALSLLEGAQRLSPNNEDFATLKRDIERLYSQHVKLDHEWRRMGDSDEQISTISGVSRISPNVEVGANFQNNEIDASQLRRASDGRILDFDTSKQRGELFAAYLFNGGDRLQASLFANNDTAGAGVYYGFNNPLGRTEVVGEYRRPYWDFVQAVVEDTTRDRIGAKHVAHLTPTTTLSAESSVNQYHISDMDDVASTALVRANIVQEIQTQNPYLGIGYGFDGEYVIDKEKLPLGNGDEYSPFPMNSREIHFVSGIIAQDLTDSTRAELVAGYAYDRLGDHGPQAEGKITQELGENVEAQLRARYGLETRNSDENVSSVGGHLMYKF